MKDDQGFNWSSKDRIIFIAGISIASILMVAMGIMSARGRVKCEKAYNAYMNYLENEGIDPQHNALEQVCGMYCGNPDAPTVPANCKMYCYMKGV